MRCRLLASLFVVSVLVTGSAQSAEPPTAAEISTLIQQLGENKSTDEVMRGKLRAIIARNQNLTTSSISSDLHEGMWSGVIEHVYVDNLDAQGNLVAGPTQFYLNTGSKHLRVFFLDDAQGHAASGQHRVIRGYRADRRILITESKQSKKKMLRINNPEQNNKH